MNFKYYVLISHNGRTLKRRITTVQELVSLHRLGLFFFCFVSSFYQLKMVNKLGEVLKAEVNFTSPLLSLLVCFKNNKENKWSRCSQTYLWNKGGLKLFLSRIQTNVF